MILTEISGSSHGKNTQKRKLEDARQRKSSGVVVTSIEHVLGSEIVHLTHRQPA